MTEVVKTSLHQQVGVLLDLPARQMKVLPHLPLHGLIQDTNDFYFLYYRVYEEFRLDVK